MIRKKRVQHLDGRQKSLVENALYAANPPVVQAVVREPLPPLQAYIHKLLHKDLNKNSIEKVTDVMYNVCSTLHVHTCRCSSSSGN